MRLRRRVAELEERVAALEGVDTTTVNWTNDWYEDAVRHGTSAHQVPVEFAPPDSGGFLMDEEWHRGRYL